jgi:putative acetyltransferase
VTTRVRAATAEDLPEVAAVFSASRRLLTFLPELHSVEEDYAFIEGQMATCPVFVAVQTDDRPIAMMVEKDSWIEHLYVSPDAVRTGAGSALLTHAQLRHDNLQLWCFAQNWQARSFYENRGFIVAETTSGSLNEAGAPDVRYVWSKP